MNTPTTTPAPAPERKRRWPWIVGGVGILITIGACSNQATEESTERIVEAAPAPAPAADAPVVTETPTTEAPAEDDSAGVMPDVVGLDLQTAQDTIQAETELFFSDSRDATGQDRMQLMDSNWVVVGQTPASGTPLTNNDVPMLDVKKFTD
jgi:hypothetical protein